MIFYLLSVDFKKGCRTPLTHSRAQSVGRRGVFYAVSVQRTTYSNVLRRMTTRNGRYCSLRVQP